MNGIQKTIGAVLLGTMAAVTPMKRAIAEEAPKIAKELAPKADEFVRCKSDFIVAPSGYTLRRSNINGITGDYVGGLGKGELQCKIGFNDKTEMNLSKEDCAAIRQELVKCN